MSELKLDLKEVGKDLEEQLKDLVPVRTRRLKNSIKYEIHETKDGYEILLEMEDYFTWLKPRRKPSKLPTRKELADARPPLPKMNDLGRVKSTQLSPRASSIMKKINFKTALEKIDKKDFEEQIKKILTYDKL